MSKGVFIIAEAGVNHNGDPDLAHKLVDLAAWCGADAIKFQIFKAGTLVSNTAPRAIYQETNLEEQGTQFSMLKKLELKDDVFRELKEHAESKGLMFLSSPFDIESIELLNRLKTGTFKIPSGEITNLPYLQKIGSLNNNIILSTGMSTLDEVEEAINILTRAGTERGKISLLHATTEYPAPPEEVNLRAMITMREKFNLPVGYSDHTSGIIIPCVAVGLGATIIEKHFTLDRNMKGPDHKASLTGEEFRQMVLSIRDVEKALGSGIKEPTKTEKLNITVVRKSIHYRASFKSGYMLGSSDIVMKRPGNGISPMMEGKIIGRTLKNDVEGDTIVRWEDLA
jgi:N,N'-diacetyllegionaminate synthase